MNWKIWTYPKAVRTLNAALTAQREEYSQAMQVRAKEIERLDGMISELEKELANWHHARNLVSKLDPASNNEIKVGLAGVSDEDKEWRAIHGLLSRQREIEQNATCTSGLTDSGAHFNRGRLAALIDFQEVLMKVRRDAQTSL
jgi:hypothetical protein